MADMEAPSEATAPQCIFFGCREDAVVRISVAHDYGYPLCSKHADEVKTYIAQKVSALR